MAIFFLNGKYYIYKKEKRELDYKTRVLGVLKAQEKREIQLYSLCSQGHQKPLCCS
jgi:hypothetical protein